MLIIKKKLKKTQNLYKHDNPKMDNTTPIITVSGVG